MTRQFLRQDCKLVKLRGLGCMCHMLVHVLGPSCKRTILSTRAVYTVSGIGHMHVGSGLLMPQ